MTKSLKFRAVAAVAGACAALFASMPANAYVYAVSKLDIKNLDISVFVAGTATDVSAATNYSFNLKNTADYTPIGGSSILDSHSAACGGNAAAQPTPTTTCGLGPVLDATVANAPGLANVRAENNFSILGSGGSSSFSNADSQITTAKLVTGGTTSTTQIAESLLNINGQASANTEVKSTTTLVTNLFFTGLTDVSLSFDALLHTSGAISDLFGGLYTSSAGANVSISLTKNNSGGQSWTWSPYGNGTGALCNGFGITGTTCGVTANGGNLNVANSVSGNPDSYDSSFTGFKNFGLKIANLAGGSYSLALQATTTTNVDRLAVPEPGSLALVGFALAGLGLAGKRRARKQ